MSEPRTTFWTCQWVIFIHWYGKGATWTVGWTILLPGQLSYTFLRGGILGTRVLGHDWLWTVLTITPPSIAVSLWWADSVTSLVGAQAVPDTKSAETESVLKGVVVWKLNQSNSDPSQVQPTSLWSNRALLDHVFAREQNRSWNASYSGKGHAHGDITHATIANDTGDQRISLNPFVSLWSADWPMVVEDGVMSLS